MGESGIAQANRLVGQYRGATLALRQNKGMEEVHAYRIAARRLLVLLALLLLVSPPPPAAAWRSRVCSPRVTLSPGSTPARNSRAMDCSVAAPYTIRMIEGGISRPKSEDTAKSALV
mgnify:CR=1 FL=1